MYFRLGSSNIFYEPSAFPYLNYLPTKFMYLKINRVLVILFYVPALKCTLQYSPIDTLYSKIPLLVVILWDMEEYGWPKYDISVPKTNILLLILFFILVSKSILQYNHIDTKHWVLINDFQFIGT